MIESEQPNEKPDDSRFDVGIQKAMQEAFAPTRPITSTRPWVAPQTQRVEKINSIISVKNMTTMRDQIEAESNNVSNDLHALSKHIEDLLTQRADLQDALNGLELRKAAVVDMIRTLEDTLGR